jgi:hypothetical protein
MVPQSALSASLSGICGISPLLLQRLAENRQNGLLRSHSVLGDVANSSTNPNSSTLLTALQLQERRLQEQIALRRAGLAAFPFSSAAATGFLPSNDVLHEAMISQAYKRGREEAILSLLSSGVVDPLAFGRAGLSPMPEPSSNIDKAPETSNDSSPGRRRQAKPYFDASALQDPDPGVMANRRTRGGVTEPFPEKLHR